MLKDHRFNPTLPVVLWGAASLGGGLLFLHGFDLDNSVGIWFPRDDPALTQYEQFLDEFGENEWTLLLVEVRPGMELDLPVLLDRLGHTEHIGKAVAVEDSAPSRGPPRRAILLETANRIHRGDAYREVMLDGVRGAVQATPAVASHAIVGTSVINVALNRSARRDMLVFFSLVLVLLVGFSHYFLGSWRDVGVLLVVALGTVMVTLGVVVGWGLRFNILTVMMPTVLIALSVADIVHLIHVFHRHREEHSARDAAQLAVREIRVPALGTTLTTLCGFLSLAVSDMPPVRHLAVFSALGLALAWVATVAVAPALLERCWRDERPVGLRRAFTGHAWFRPRSAKPILIGTTFALVVLSGWGQLRTDTNYLRFFRPGSRIDRDYAMVEEAGFARSGLQLAVSVSDRTALPGFAERLRGLPGVKGVMVADPLGSTPRTRVDLFTDFLGNRGVKDLQQRILRVASASLPPDSEVLVTGSPVLWERMDASLVRTQQSSLVLVSFAVFLVLLAVFRSWGAALLTWLVSLFPVGVILGLMGWLGISINLGTVLIAGIAIGLAVDDSIHLVFAYRREVRAGTGEHEAVRIALSRVGGRLVPTSVILMGGFGCMVVSDFVPTSEFGIFTSLTILLALVVDLTLLPLLLPRMRNASRVGVSHQGTALGPN